MAKKNQEPLEVQTGTKIGTDSVALIGLAVISVLGFGYFALNALNSFLPLGTLNPNCTPGTPGCSIASPIVSGGTSDLTFGRPTGTISFFGKVGIGTSTPDRRLSIFDLNGLGFKVETPNDSGNKAISLIAGTRNINIGFGNITRAAYFWSNLPFFIGEDGNPTLFVSSTGMGKVGIDNNDPKTALDVTGEVTIRNGAAYANNLVCYTDTGALGHCSTTPCTCLAN